MKKTLEQIFTDAAPLDQRSASMIIKALQNANLDGFDYLEFKQSLASLAQLNMDENTRFQSAYITASTLGLTKSRLLETAQFYIKVAGKEKEKFDQAAEHQFNKGIGIKKGQLDKLESAITQKEEQIKKLQAEIAQHHEKVASLKEELSGAEGKIKAAQGSFENAFTLIVEHIQEDIKKINMYIS